MQSRFRFLLVLVPLAILAACEAGGGAADDGLLDGPLDPDYGKPLLGVPPQSGKEDGTAGVRALPTSVDTSDSAVWEVTAQWEDTDTTAARRAGMAWGADSGLTWDEKYARWVRSLRRIPGHETYYETYELTTPWGKTVPSPALECAETGIFLRTTFASWYGLPFYMVAGGGETAYFGHFGARTASGRYSGMPAFKTRYTDYTAQFAGRSNADVVASWPHDTALQARRLGTAGDDLVAFLGEEAGAGAYFDEIYLNKRVGHFMVILLSYYGSIHLASPDNTFNLQPAAIREGDLLLERWQSQGIGHTLVVKSVEPLGDGRIEAELISGSMPRRQGKWDDAATSKSYLTNDYMGGSGTSAEGATYAQLGGGLKRWRIPKVRSGYWYLAIPAEDASVWVNSTDLAAIGARPEQFEGLLGELTPEVERDSLLAQIESNRAHLRAHPASCSARERREDAFERLYTLLDEEWGTTREEADRRYRVLDDYVFAELAYTQSKTCCWNSSNADMYAAIMAYAREVTAAGAGGTSCTAPPVFKATSGGYAPFADYAAAHGFANWVAWSEDEPCPQRGTVNDVEATHAWTAVCRIVRVLLGLDPADPADPSDPTDPSDPEDPDDEANAGGSGGDGCARGPQPVSPAGFGLLVVPVAAVGWRRRRV